MKTSINILDYSFLIPSGDTINDMFNGRLSTNECVNRIENYQPEKYIGVKGHKYYTLQTKYLLSSILPLFKKSQEIIITDDLGIVTGSSFGSYEEWKSLSIAIKENGYDNIPPMQAFNFSTNIPSSIASIRTKAKAFNVTLTSGVNAGYDALIFAIDNLILNNAKEVIASGVEFIDSFAQDCIEAFYKTSQEPPSITEGSASILLSKQHIEQRKSVILSYNANFIPYISRKNKNEVIEQYSNNIKQTLSDANLTTFDINLIISASCGNQQLENYDAEIKSTTFNDKPLSIDVKKNIGELFSTGAILQNIIASKVLENDYTTLKQYNLPQSNIHIILLTYIGVDGYIYSSIIKK